MSFNIDVCHCVCYNIHVFENIKFDGQFRTYQQKILDEADKYLKDGHINIVAAPGSGKTILGLELIRRLDSPCIIFSPTTTIRNQWVERFEQCFLGDSNLEDYISFDLNTIKPITSVTYQALHAAMKKIQDGEEGVDYSALDIVAEVRKCGVGTVCLDEAHHLQNEWQKALEKFLGELNGNIKVISLTATPPYDADQNEWKRYIGICGEIDEEIFVPELVKQKTLCPHQDYIYFNYPTSEEAQVFDEYRRRAVSAVQEIISSGMLAEAYGTLFSRANDYDYLYTNAGGVIAFLSLCSHSGMRIDKKLVRSLATVKRLPGLNLERLERAINFLAESDLLSGDSRGRCIEIFKKSGLVERGEIKLDLNKKLKTKLISSVGKLKSIYQIAESEYSNLGNELRLLILTDFIKKDSISLIGSDKPVDNVSIVSVFETVRKTGIRVGALSGSLVILPDDCIKTLRCRGFSVSASVIEGVGCSVCEIGGDNRLKVRAVSWLFEEGKINAIVGTKSLLGEGWDAPCVNSLILASFVGSFMLSNQMRGRAIRIDKNQPEKVANIWHLVTIERPFIIAEIGEKVPALFNENNNVISSCDFRTLARRFECFVAPNYETGEVESGIDRIVILKPPFNEKGIADINAKMVARSRDRTSVKAAWDRAVGSSARLNEVSEVPKGNKIPPVEFINIGFALVLAAILSMGISQIVYTFTTSLAISNGQKTLLTVILVIIIILSLLILRDLIFNKILSFINPTRAIRTLANCILETMQEKSMVSNDARVKVNADENGLYVKVELLNASVHDQNVFHTAIKQLLSPIENPRYIIILRGLFGRLRYINALACPDILGSKSEYAHCLAQKFKRSMGKVQMIYTRTQNGRKFILKCRKLSYITYNDKTLYKRKKMISRWE